MRATALLCFFNLKASLPGVLAAFLLGALFHAKPAEADSGDIVTIGINPDYPPFNTLQLPRGGFATALVEDAFARAGVTPSILHMPWRRAMRQVAEGRVDVTHPWFFREVRAEVMYFSEPYLWPKEAVYVSASLAQARPMETAEDLEGLTVCSPADYVLPEPVQTLIKQGKVLRDAPRDVSDCMRMLVGGRIDFVVLSPVIFKSDPIQRIVSGQGVVRTSVPVEVEPYYVLVGKRNPRGPYLIDAFNRGLNAMAADGSLAALADAYDIPHDMLPHLSGN